MRCLRSNVSQRAPRAVSRRWNVRAQVPARLQPFTLSSRHLLEAKQTQLKIDLPWLHRACTPHPPPAPDRPVGNGDGEMLLHLDSERNEARFVTRRNKVNEKGQTATRGSCSCGAGNLFDWWATLGSKMWMDDVFC